MESQEDNILLCCRCGKPAERALYERVLELCKKLKRKDPVEPICIACIAARIGEARNFKEQGAIIDKKRLYVIIDDVEFEVGYDPSISEAIARQLFVRGYFFMKQYATPDIFNEFVEYNRRRMTIRKECANLGVNTVIDPDTALN